MAVRPICSVKSMNYNLDCDLVAVVGGSCLTVGAVSTGENFFSRYLQLVFENTEVLG